MKKLLLTLFLFPIFTFGQNEICESLSIEFFPDLSDQINTYFINNNLDSLGQNKTDIKFNEIDYFIDYLSQLNCIDTAYYRNNRGSIMKTAIGMTDIILSSSIHERKKSYIIRFSFEN
jgi:hypothetical protein